MKTRFHGSMPADVRDHGVFSVKKQESPLYAVQSKTKELQEKKNELNARLEPLLAKVKDGSASVSDLQSVNDLARQASELADALRAAERELAEAERLQSAMALAQGRARFDQLVVDATKHREEFERLFREACIHLGSYCAAVDEAQSFRMRSRLFFACRSGCASPTPIT